MLRPRLNVIIVHVKSGILDVFIPGSGRSYFFVQLWNSKVGKRSIINENARRRLDHSESCKSVSCYSCLSHAAAACMSADFFNEKDLQLLQPNTSTSEKRLNSEICGQYLSAGRYYNRCYCCKIQFFTGSMKVQNYQMILDK